MKITIKTTVFLSILAIAFCGFSYKALAAQDTIGPGIVLNGTNPMNVRIGGVFVDPGATAHDSISGSVRVIATVPRINTSVSGTYTVTYAATDSIGNSSTLSRTVIVGSGGSVLGASTSRFVSVLKQGSRGTEVRNLQEYLIRKGYMQGTSTGIFGHITKQALIKFQTVNALDAVGYTGPKTRALLNK